MSDAVERGLAFLLSAQDPAGFWSDWELPVGSSSMWTTAYVGWRLSSCEQRTASSLERAADWLETNELGGGGWGYTEDTGADADSTALGILFLEALERRAPPSAVQRLLGFIRGDGGFATYGFDQSFGAWTASHVEVTATAALALRAIGEAPEVVERAADFLRRGRRVDGLWNSYWWTSPCYATEIATHLLGEQARQEARKGLLHLRVTNPFEAALRSLVLGAGARSLVETQGPDGSWPSAPILRLTHRDIYSPQSGENDGPCFADRRRIFTTATAVAALGISKPAI